MIRAHAWAPIVAIQHLDSVFLPIDFWFLSVHIEPFFPHGACVLLPLPLKELGRGHFHKENKYSFCLILACPMPGPRARGLPPPGPRRAAYAQKIQQGAAAPCTPATRAPATRTAPRSPARAPAHDPRGKTIPRDPRSALLVKSLGATRPLACCRLPCYSITMPTPPVPYFLGARGRIGARVYRLFHGKTYTRSSTWAKPADTQRQREIHLAFQLCQRSWLDHWWITDWTEAWTRWARLHGWSEHPYNSLIRAAVSPIGFDVVHGIFDSCWSWEGRWAFSFNTYWPVPHPYEYCYIQFYTGPTPNTLTLFAEGSWDISSSWEYFAILPPPLTDTCWQIYNWGKPISGIYTARLT